MQLSYSKIKTFRDCPKRYELKYVRHLSEPESPELELGTLGHEVLEHYYAQQIRSQELIDNLVKLYGGKHSEWLSNTLQGYHDFASKYDKGMESIQTEFEVKRTLGRHTLVGKVDAVFNAGGVTAALEHKFKGKWADTFEQSLAFEDQPKTYAVLANLNLVFYNLIRTKPAKTRPQFERIPVMISEDQKLGLIENVIKWGDMMENAEKLGVFPHCSGYMSQWCPCRIMASENEEIPRVVIAQSIPHTDG
jgi:hypothetical protein